MASDSAIQQSKNHTQISKHMGPGSHCTFQPSHTGNGRGSGPASPESACPPSTAWAGPEYSQGGKAQPPRGVKGGFTSTCPSSHEEVGIPGPPIQASSLNAGEVAFVLKDTGEVWGTVNRTVPVRKGQDLNRLRRVCHPSRCIPPTSCPHPQACKGCDCPPGTPRRRGDRERGGGNAFRA